MYNFIVATYTMNDVNHLF